MAGLLSGIEQSGISLSVSSGCNRDQSLHLTERPLIFEAGIGIQLLPLIQAVELPLRNAFRVAPQTDIRFALVFPRRSRLSREQGDEK